MSNEYDGQIEKLELDLDKLAKHKRLCRSKIIDIETEEKLVLKKISEIK
jgi:hypothetical protein